MRLLKFKSFEEFTSKLKGSDLPELANSLFEAIQRGMKNNNKKVSVCDVLVEEEEEMFTLYSPREDWPTALESCLKAFINTEEYEKCIVVQELKKEYEINKLVTEANISTSTRSKGNGSTTDATKSKRGRKRSS